MRPNKSDVLIAFKAISLTEEMSVTEKRVAATLLDHYNRDTGQCDPALNTIATLLGINRRTVIRATGSLEESGYFRIDRHGGKFHRNSYQPIWARFRACENGWAERRKRAKQFPSAASELSPLQGPRCHIGGGGSATQTYSNNQSDLTSASQQRQSQQCRFCNRGASSKEALQAKRKWSPVFKRTRAVSRETILRRHCTHRG